MSSVGLVDDCFIAGFVVMQSPSTLGGGSTGPNHGYGEWKLVNVFIYHTLPTPRSGLGGETRETMVDSTNYRSLPFDYVDLLKQVYVQYVN